jgi:hypothetical protein
MTWMSIMFLIICCGVGPSASSSSISVGTWFINWCMCFLENIAHVVQQNKLSGVVVAKIIHYIPIELCTSECIFYYIILYSRKIFVTIHCYSSLFSVTFYFFLLQTTKMCDISIPGSFLLLTKWSALIFNMSLDLKS